MATGRSERVRPGEKKACGEGVNGQRGRKKLLRFQDTETIPGRREVFCWGAIEGDFSKRDPVYKEL